MLKKLNQSDYKLKIIKDLGMCEYGKTTDAKGNLRKIRLVNLECACGNILTSQASNAKNIGSCRRCSSAIAGLKHGDTGTRLYTIWQQILNRTKVGNVSAKDYGDMGISICKDWENYIVFKKWALANGYTATLSIDRKDNDGNYEPSNCRWTTQTIQSRNTRLLRVTNTSGFRGVYFSERRSKWIAQIKVNYKTMYLGAFSTSKDASKAYDTYVTNNNLEHTKNERI